VAPPPARADFPGDAPPPSLAEIARSWGRIGCVGFGGPPAHIALLRELCVERRGWLSPAELEDAIAACNLLPGPASTQLAIFCAWRLRGALGALVGAAGFILPGLAVILALSAVFLGGRPPDWVRGAGAGAGAAVAAVAVHAGLGLLPGSRAGPAHLGRTRRLLYLLGGGVASATIGPWLVVVLLLCGGGEVLRRRRDGGGPALLVVPWPLVAAAGMSSGGLPALAWVALKVGALSYGGGFVIVPLMQADAVGHFHWMTASQFLGAVALGQVTPGPLTHTVAVVGYAAAGLAGGLLAAAVAFAPSLAFVLLGARRFAALRRHPDARAFLDGAGPAAIGAILGSSVPLALALTEGWQIALLAAAAVALIGLRRGVVTTLVAAGVVGAVVGLAGGPLP
jgi:chromate transporter